MPAPTNDIYKMDLKLEGNEGRDRHKFIRLVKWMKKKVCFLVKL